MLIHPSVRYPRESVEDDEALNSQGFAWHSNGVLFSCKDGCVWLAAYEAEDAQVKPETETAILVPVVVPKEGYLHTLSEDKEEPLKIMLEPGRYNLLFELRDLLSEEHSIEKYKEAYDLLEPNFRFTPELCTMTFVATEEKSKPQLLRFTPTIPMKYRKKVREGTMTVEDFMPKALILSEEKY